MKESTRIHKEEEEIRDRKLLEVLQNDAWLENYKIARKIGDSDSGALRRLNRLINEGVIVGSSIKINPEKVGVTCEAVVLIKMRSGVKATEKIEGTLKRIKWLRWVYRLSAPDFDYAILIRTYSNERLSEVLQEINSIEEVTTVQPYPVGKALKDDPRIVFEEKARERHA